MPLWSTSSDVVNRSGQAIAVEIIEDAAAGQVRAPRRQAGPRRHVLEPAHVELRAERVQRDQVMRRHLVRDTRPSSM